MVNIDTYYVNNRGAICLQNCNSPIVLEVAISMGMRVVKFTDKWDLYWCDTPLDIKKIKDLKKYQVSHKHTKI